MKRKAQSDAPGDAEVRRLLVRYQCPVPFHAVRSRFLGHIVCPGPGTPPMQALQELWDGEFPRFESIDEANTLFEVLLKGLWNRLTRHQERKSPFRLTRVPTPTDGEELKQFAQRRVDELEGFADGLFAGEDELELPERAHQAMQELGDLNSFFAAFVQFADEPDTDKEFAETARNAQQLSYIAEKEINAVVLACTKARRQMLTEQGVGRPRLH